MKKYIVISCLLLSALSLEAQTVTKEQIRQETLPDGQVVRVHVSGRNDSAAALLQRSDGYWVYINQHLYGPFEDVDLRNSNPFSDEGNNWEFRAVQGGRQLLVVNGIQYGPFDAIWTPSFSKSGRHWGAMIKEGDHYAILADGSKTRSFDWIFNEVDSQGPAVDAHMPAIAPFFYGDNEGWLALGANKPDSQRGLPAEFRILSERGESPDYDKVGTLDASNPTDSFFRTKEYLTINDRKFVFSVHSAEQAADEYYLWVDHMTYGPYHGIPESWNFTINRVSDDGSNWIIAGIDKLYTKDKVLPFKGEDLSISQNGRTFSFSYIRDDFRYVNVNEHEYGPFLDVNPTVFSPTGEHWLFSSRVNADQFNQLTGPTSTFGLFYNVQQIFFRNADWFALATDENQDNYVYKNGVKIFGPLGVAKPDPSNNRQDEAWNLVAADGDQLVLIINGEIRFRLPHAHSGASTVTSLVSKDGAHWALVARSDDRKIAFIDNGLVVNGLPDVWRGLQTSESRDKTALIYLQFNKYYLVVAGQTYGPYRTMPLVTFSSFGRAWAASMRDETGEVLILPSTAPATYNQVAELKNVRGDDAVLSNGFRDNRWSPRVNTAMLGTFAHASINCSTDGSKTIFLATNDGDRKLTVYKVRIQR